MDSIPEGALPTSPIRPSDEPGIAAYVEPTPAPPFMLESPRKSGDGLLTVWNPDLRRQA